jgi:serine/threonine protein kinase
MPSPEPDADHELLELVGRTVAGKYRVDRLIGRGGMGAVFQATNQAIGKRVALKFLKQEAARNREACIRFQREAEAAGLVESAHIVHIFDSGTTEEGLPFLVMELLSGEDLRAVLRRERRVSLESALRVAVQVLRALVRAHAAGIVHRDLKPDNIFLCARDDEPSFVKIVDFGISKLAHARAADTLTRGGTVLGTAYYMSPEQSQSFADIDGRTDLFSLGAILFEMLSGRPPHLAPTYESVLISICTKDAADIRTFAPDVPPVIADIVKKALARDRAQRFQTAGEFLEALNLAQASGEFRAETPSAAAAPNAWPQTPRRYGMVVASVIATLTGFALTAYFVSRHRASASVTPVELPAALTSAEPPIPEPTATPSVAVSAPDVTVAKPSAMPRPAASATSHTARHAPPKPGSGIAGGLQLSTREP